MSNELRPFKWGYLRNPDLIAEQIEELNKESNFLTEALKVLTKKQFDYLLAWANGNSQYQIAEWFGVRRTTVQKSITRSIIKLKQYFGCEEPNSNKERDPNV